MTDPDNGDRVAIVGDLHGVQSAVARVFEQAAEHKITTMYQVGDAGIWPGPAGRHFMTTVEVASQRTGIRMYVVPGNHDAYNLIEDAYAQGPGPQPLGALWVLPRGHRWTHAGANFLAVGGAASVDVDLRELASEASTISSALWWPQELPSDAEIDAITTGQHADVLLMHESPASPVTAAVQKIRDSRSGWSIEGLSYAERSLPRFQRVVDDATPGWIFHGHHHLADRIDTDTQHVISLNANARAGTVAIFDIRQRTVEVLGE